MVAGLSGATKGALVQLKVPPFHLSMVGFPAPSGTPTANPSESLSMKTDKRVEKKKGVATWGDVVVLHIAPDTELQFDRQNAATPAAPTAQMFPPEGAKVTEFRPTSGPGGGRVITTWFTGIRVQEGAESSEVP
jgi:hypothetical protein